MMKLLKKWDYYECLLEAVNFWNNASVNEHHTLNWTCIPNRYELQIVMLCRHLSYKNIKKNHNDCNVFGTRGDWNLMMDLITWFVNFNLKDDTYELIVYKCRTPIMLIIHPDANIKFLLKDDDSFIITVSNFQYIAELYAVIAPVLCENSYYVDNVYKDSNNSIILEVCKLKLGFEWDNNDSIIKNYINKRDS